MALGPDPLDEATRAAREEETDWPDLADRIKTKVRAVRLPSRPLATYTPTGTPVLDDGDPVTVPSREVLGALRTLLQAPTHAPEDIALVVDGGRLSRVEVDVVARYGEPLRPLLDTLWERVSAALRDHLGPDPAFEPERDVVVRAVDVVDGDPRLT